jgi:hypothetical protein
MTEAQTVNCETDCVNSCLLGDDCPKREFREQAAQFIADTSLDTMLEMADAAVRRRALERMIGGGSSPWVFPEDGIQPEER